MIEIWEECTQFQTTRQRLTDQVRMINKNWFSDLEILEMCQKTNSKSKQEDTNINNNKHTKY